MIVCIIFELKIVSSFYLFLYKNFVVKCFIMCISVDVIKMENSIEEINQEGFVFKVFKQQKDNEIEDCYNFDIPKLSEEIINSLPIEKSTFLISNRDRLLSARVNNNLVFIYNIYITYLIKRCIQKYIFNRHFFVNIFPISLLC